MASGLGRGRSGGSAVEGSGGSSYLSAGQEAELEDLLRAGPMAHGWEDQRWTLARIGRLIEERFHVTYEFPVKSAC